MRTKACLSVLNNCVNDGSLKPGGAGWRINWKSLFVQLWKTKLNQTHCIKG